jgi:hypothetical protein
LVPEALVTDSMDKSSVNFFKYKLLTCQKLTSIIGHRDSEHSHSQKTSIKDCSSKHKRYAVLHIKHNYVRRGIPHYHNCNLKVYTALFKFGHFHGIAFLLK